MQVMKVIYLIFRLFLFVFLLCLMFNFLRFLNFFFANMSFIWNVFICLSIKCCVLGFNINFESYLYIFNEHVSDENIIFWFFYFKCLFICALCVFNFLALFLFFVLLLSLVLIELVFLYIYFGGVFSIINDDESNILFYFIICLFDWFLTKVR